MKRRSAPGVATVLVIAAAIGLAPDLRAAGDPPKEGGVRLVLQITVDGLRADLLERYRASFGEGGFERLLSGGVVYANAHYGHANTETIVGHTTLATGATPAVHGMIGNAWFDPAAGRLAYNIEDAEHPLLPTRRDGAEGVQFDPAQLAAGVDGRSPRAILVPTFSDALSVAHAGGAKVFAVSGKDRSAVSMAGHIGKAFWFSTDSTDFVTSSYYYESYPAWVAAWNEAGKAKAYAGTKWELGSPADSYLLIGQDDRPYEVDLRGYGRTFPHAFGAANDPMFPTRLLVSPIGDELLADFAEALVTNEGLGRDAVPDYLSVSFSGVDAVNHFFGPSSLENEETVRRLDRTLAGLFTFVDRAVGLDKTLIVLSADHGMPEMPEYMSGLGYRAGRLNAKDVVAAANRVGEELGVEGVVRNFFRPNLYLDHQKIADAGLDEDVVAERAAAAIVALEGVAHAVPSGALGEISPDPAIGRIRNNYTPARSGDIYVTQRPYWFLLEKGPVACMHGSPWAYDTHVPIIFAGPGIRPRRVLRPVRPIDVAPTLAAFLGVGEPAGSQGEPLVEVLGD